MKKHKNLEGNSGVSAYETGDDHIIIQFVRNSKPYTYSYDKAGKKHVENMKKLAKKGSGLSTYISQHVHDLYDR
jgi:hypothetical protein